MKNKIYQWLWYKILKKVIPICAGDGPFRSHKRTKAQFNLASVVGEVKAIIFGDSEIQMFDSFSVMKDFNNITLNMGEGGTYPSQWVEYFLTTGESLYNKIIDKKITTILSVGGNCALRSKMKELPGSLEALNKMFPNSFIMLIPPVQTGGSADLLNEINYIRDLQRSFWGDRVIDTYTPFLDPQTGTSTILYLQDPFHFSRIAVDLIQKALEVII